MPPSKAVFMATSRREFSTCSSSSLIELKTDAGRQNHVKFSSAPRLHLQRSYLSRYARIFPVECVKIGDANAVARIVGPYAVVIKDEIECNSVALNSGPFVCFP